MVALLDLRDRGVVEIDVEGDDLDAGIERLLHHVAQCFRLAMGLGLMSCSLRKSGSGVSRPGTLS